VVERSLGAYPVLGQFPVRVEVANPDHALLPGFPVEATVEVEVAADALLVPREALVEGDAARAPAVWVADGAGARRAEVRAGPTDGRVVAVEGDLREGDLVVTLGRADLRRDGQRILVVAGP
jgi:multidrug efflux system membrane fusion protein